VRSKYSLVSKRYVPVSAVKITIPVDETLHRFVACCDKHPSAQIPPRSGKFKLIVTLSVRKSATPSAMAVSSNTLS
jgi:hypothetical protein